ncbi:T9SS type A sorting domain-containing protein [Pedobacter sp. MC2016-14]|uniref:T9SS type A sorting domain-containing protein n=1 Tax=Pedobacter sp. MC2016-14 TaxID=2897327 RepID=UPI001E544D81|nr:T9SS type A sorting domain-containing protein [Pedobacter sp. MC2016-14]MCD0490279.1 T9SS type A sorting domain-containing protein [Pedobacter sp. MC2016-14]
MNKTSKTAFFAYVICCACISLLCSMPVLAQKSDSIYYSSRAKKVNRTPTIKANIQSYKPSYNAGLGYLPYNNSLLNAKGSIKQDKILSVSKVYPNPVDDQVNVTLKLDREGVVSIKIIDLLGNEVITLANERMVSGEQTKSFTIPNKLNSGIYFLRIVCGAETIVKRISVI